MTDPNPHDTINDPEVKALMGRKRREARFKEVNARFPQRASGEVAHLRGLIKLLVKVLHLYEHLGDSPDMASSSAAFFDMVIERLDVCADARKLTQPD